MPDDPKWWHIEPLLADIRKSIVGYIVPVALTALVAFLLMFSGQARQWLGSKWTESPGGCIAAGLALVACVSSWKWFAWKRKAKKFEAESLEKEARLGKLAATCSELEAANLERMSKIEELEAAASEEKRWHKIQGELAIVSPLPGVTVAMRNDNRGKHPKIFVCIYCVQKRDGVYILQKTLTDKDEIMRCPHCAKDYQFGPYDGLRL